MHFQSKLARTCAFSLVLPVAYLLAACGDITTPARTPELSADPPIICPGGQVTLRWRTEGGGVELTQSSQGGGSSTLPVATSGQQPFTLLVTTTFTMRVGTGWNRPASQSTTVQVVTSLDQTLGGTATCEGRTIRTFSGLTAVVPSSLHSMVVSNVTISGPADRDVTVAYGGREFTGRGATSVFNGMNITLGNWFITASLLGNEECPGAAPPGTINQPPTPVRQPPPSALTIDVSLVCPPRPGGSAGAGSTGAGGCGGMGQPCCSGSCNGGLECTAGTCQPAGMTGDRTCEGNPVGATTQPFQFRVRDRYGCGAILAARANSIQEAERCVRAQLVAGQTIVSEPAELQYYPVASTTSALGCVDRQVAVFSADDVRGCAQSLCPIDCVSIEPGVCPQETP